MSYISYPGIIRIPVLLYYTYFSMDGLGMKIKSTTELNMNTCTNNDNKGSSSKQYSNTTTVQAVNNSKQHRNTAAD